MLKKVVLQSTIQQQDFLRFLDSTQQQELAEALEKLKGKKVVHVNSTVHGGGVAELLKALVPYLRSLGIDAEWYAIDPEEAGNSFFDFTNRLHNALQGSIRRFSKEDWDRYEKINKEIARDVDKLEYDILVVHDPQPLGAVRFLRSRKPKACVIHIDTSSADPISWKQVLDLAKRYNRIIFSNEEFINKDLPKEKLRVFTPAIDPLASKQEIVPVERARAYLSDFGIPTKGVLIVQVSRFDVWKNPFGLVEAFWLLEEKHSNIILALVGFQEARDNPEAEKVYNDIKGMAGKDSNIFLFFDPKKIGGAEHIEEFTKMVQNAADIVVQNSTKEGFGLTVAEAMWKRKAVVGGPASGIRKQIQDGENGLIASNTSELAICVEDLVMHPENRQAIGEKARTSVERKFLMPRFVLDHLKVYNEVV